MRTFETLNIEILPYNELVDRAKRAYRDHLKVLDEAEQVPFLHVEASDDQIEVTVDDQE